MSTTLFLAVRTGPHEVGMVAECVKRVVVRADWEGPEPPDLEQLIAGARPRGACRHVLVVSTEHDEWSLGTVREIVLRVLPVCEIHELPALLWEPETPSVIHSIATVPHTPPLFVLDLAQLSARAANSAQGNTR